MPGICLVGWLGKKWGSNTEGSYFMGRVMSYVCQHGAGVWGGFRIYIMEAAKCSKFI